MELHLSIDRVDAVTYKKLSAALSERENASGPGELFEAIQPDLLKLLSREPHYAVDKLVVVIDGQQGEFSFDAAVKGVTEEDGGQPPMALISKATVTADAVVPVAWVQKISASKAEEAGVPADPEAADRLIDEAVSRGFVVRDGAVVKSKLRFTKGALEVNGKAIPL
ncbi:MAG: DUF945 family protein [Anaeromyxobacter sp.]